MAAEGRLIDGSSAYAAFERVLAPALLATPFVRQVEMAFSDSANVVAVSRRIRSDGRWQLTMRSSAAECFLLGSTGCIDSGAPPGERPDWWFSSRTLPAHVAGGYGSLGDAVPGARGAGVTSGWEAAPVLMETEEAVVAWSAVYRLHFHCGSELLVAGRVALELGELSDGGSDSWCHDEQLGDEGRIYLCDAAGNILASRLPQDVLTAASGRLRFRRLWELPDAAWAPQLRAAFGGGAVADTRLLHADGTQVVLQHLPAPLEHFAIVIATPSTSPFVNLPMYTASVTSAVVVLAPLTVCAFVLVGVLARFWRSSVGGKEKPMPASPVRPTTIAGTGRRRFMSDSLIRRFKSFRFSRRD